MPGQAPGLQLHLVKHAHAPDACASGWRWLSLGWCCLPRHAASPACGAPGAAWQTTQLPSEGCYLPTAVVVPKSRPGGALPSVLPQCCTVRVRPAPAALCQLTMGGQDLPAFSHRHSCPAGMLQPVPTEAIHIPALCLAGRLPLSNNAVMNLDLTSAQVQPV